MTGNTRREVDEDGLITNSLADALAHPLAVLIG